MPTLTTPAPALTHQAPPAPAVAVEPLEFAVFVSSTDSYADCWTPFFTLFKHYWPNFRGRIYLSTETKTFEFPGLDIVCTQVARFAGGKTPMMHGRRLKLAFQHVVKEDLVLYLHEDMFLTDFVRENVLQDIARTMRANQLLFTILSEAGNRGRTYATPWSHLLELDPENNYFFSAMAGMWHVPRMARYLRSHETPWQTEFYVKRRLRRHRERAFTLDLNLHAWPHNAVFPFSPDTGIATGRWHRHVVEDLFAQHHIALDFTQRGFFDPNQSAPAPIPQPFWKRLLSALRSRW